MAFEKGNKVEITGQTMGGNEVVEGIATLVEPIATGSWWVRFDGDATEDLFTRDESRMELVTS